MTTPAAPEKTRQTRQYAERRFDGRRNADPESAVVSDHPDSGPVMAADSPEGGPLTVESSAVIGGGTAARRVPVPRGGRRTGIGTAPEAAVWQPVGGGEVRNAATWDYALAGQQQDTILPTVGAEGARQDPGRVPVDQLITRQQRVGPAAPTGEPCTCAYQWEEGEDGRPVNIRPTAGGLPTGFRGAPRWMTWCIICGGERGDNGAPLVNPENAIKYGDSVPDRPKTRDEAALDQRIEHVLERQAAAFRAAPVDEAALAEKVAAIVFERVADTLAAPAFLDVLAERLGAGKPARSRKAPAAKAGAEG